MSVSKRKMRGATGTPMQSIEFAPKKKGNAKCSECVHLIYKPKRISKSEYCSYYCDAKQQPRFYTARCFCKNYEEVKK